MKSSLLAVFFLCLFFQLSSQNLELSGKVDYFSLPATGKIYYAEEGKKFDATKFVTYDENKTYHFKMPLSKIKKENIRTLVFSADTTQSTNAEYQCVHKIYVGEIVNAPEFAKQKNIRLRADLDLDFNCESSAYYDAKEDDLQRFVGYYSLVVNDTTHSIELGNVFFRYTATLSAPTSDHVNQEFGSWEYNKNSNVLTLYIWHLNNQQYGLQVKKRYEYAFKVDESTGRMVFKPLGAGVLRKR